MRYLLVRSNRANCYGRWAQNLTPVIYKEFLTEDQYKNIIYYSEVDLRHKKFFLVLRLLCNGYTNTQKNFKNF